MWSRGGVDVASEEVVHGDVPFAGEFEPVCAVPPVGVEVAVCETWMEFVSYFLLLYGTEERGGPYRLFPRKLQGRTRRLRGRRGGRLS